MHFLNRLLGIEAYWQKANPIPSLLPLPSFSSCASVAGMVTQVHSARECYDGSVAREYGLHGAAWLPVQGVELIVVQFPWERISRAYNWGKGGLFYYLLGGTILRVKWPNCMAESGKYSKYFWMKYGKSCRALFCDCWYCSGLHEFFCPSEPKLKISISPEFSCFSYSMVC